MMLEPTKIAANVQNALRHKFVMASLVDRINVFCVPACVTTLLVSPFKDYRYD